MNLIFLSLSIINVIGSLPIERTAKTLRGSLALRATQCSLYFDKHQKTTFIPSINTVSLAKASMSCGGPAGLACLSDSVRAITFSLALLVQFSYTVITLNLYS